MGRDLLLIVVSVTLSAVAQVLFRGGMMGAGEEGLSPAALLHPAVLGGVACYGVSVAMWLYILTRVDVSAAYPLASIGFIVTAVAGWRLFGERLSEARLAGILLICVGVVLVSSSHRPGRSP